MDTIEFIQARNRMRGICSEVWDLHDTNLEDVVKETEQWFIEHPFKTLQDEFLKLWPNASIVEDNILEIRPCELDTSIDCEDKDGKVKACGQCRKEFWMQEVK